MLSVSFKQTMEKRLTETAVSFGTYVPTVLKALQETEGDERALLILAYTTLPSSDAFDAAFLVMRRMARQALWLRDHSPYCRDVSEEMFLQFVFYPRINSEDLADCRGLFARQIWPRIQGMGEEEAAREVNRWCAEHMTYEASSVRTENPLTAWKSGTGRCGEESTFLVTALRSVGFPARQIYVPYWAHCDDNHAWTEVFVEGRWQYLGACEPEPILNRGWFTEAASRAPLAVCRTFYPRQDEQRETEEAEEQINVHQPFWEPCLYNVTSHYAEVSRLRVFVKDSSGGPAAGAQVELSLVNEAALCPIAWGGADENGMYTLSLGRGTALIAVTKDGRSAEKIVTLGEEDLCVELALSPYGRPPGMPGIAREMDFVPPRATGRNRTILTQVQQEENEVVLARCRERRLSHLRSFDLPAYQETPAVWQEIFRKAGGNAPELYGFYREQKPEEQEMALAFLDCLEEKDFKDVKESILRAHFTAGKRMFSAVDMGSGQSCRVPGSVQPCPKELYLSYVLNPRICNEVLGDWRSAVLRAFSEEERKEAVRDPQNFMELLCRRYPERNGRYYRTLSVRPQASLALGQTDAEGRKLLFVAVMRTIGIPARISPADGLAEYWRDGVFHEVHESEDADEERSAVYSVTLHPVGGAIFSYGGNVSLSVRERDGKWRFLPMEETNGEAKSVGEILIAGGDGPVRLSAGAYRLITSNRLPGGTQLCRFTDFSVGTDRGCEGAVLDVTLRRACLEEMLEQNPLEPFMLSYADGTAWTSEHKKEETILCFLDPGKEPTEHLLRELLEAASEINGKVAAGNLQTALILKKRKTDTESFLRQIAGDGLVGEISRAIPEAQILYDDFGPTAMMLARKMFLEPEVWPLLILTDGSVMGQYGHAGYQVGIVNLTLRLAELAETM